MTPQRSASVASRQGCKIATNPTFPFVHCGEYLQGLFNLHQDIFSLDLEPTPFVRHSLVFRQKELAQRRHYETLTDTHRPL